jgi:hypothetical protein
MPCADGEKQFIFRFGVNGGGKAMGASFGEMFDWHGRRFRGSRNATEGVPYSALGGDDVFA